MNNPKTTEDNDPCPCDSGKTYIKCCWIQDALWEKKEKSRIPFEDLKEAMKEKAFQCYSLRFLERLCEYFGFVKARRDKQQGPFSESLFVKTSPFFEKYITWNIQ